MSLQGHGLNLWVKAALSIQLCHCTALPCPWWYLRHRTVAVWHLPEFECMLSVIYLERQSVWWPVVAACLVDSGSQMPEVACHVTGLQHSHCGERRSWFLLIHSEHPPWDNVSDLISLCCSSHFQVLFTLWVNPLCLHLPHLVSNFLFLPECLLTAPGERAKLVALHQRWVFGRIKRLKVF